MPIKKQEFYEGAALHRLARTGRIDSVRFSAPFFILNDSLAIHLKYSTKKHSPWGFTFMPQEQCLLEAQARSSPLFIGLVCGGDGVAGLSYDDYCILASTRGTSLRVACARAHGKHYAITGPDGRLERKIPPSLWDHIL